MLEPSSYLATLGAGVLGGLILNVMPCVLPVLFLKARSLIMHQGGEGGHRAPTLAYFFGAQVAFSLFALMVISLRASGETLGWGMQMQNPYFVGGLALMMALFALNSFDLFLANLGATHSRKGRHELLESFLEGVLVTLASTPCSAPILGTATTAALASDKSWWETLGLFWSIGLGLTLPILLLGFVPALARLVPSPGDWMKVFKRFVGVTMVAATFWLYTQVEQLVTRDVAHGLIYGLSGLTLLVWQVKRWRTPEYEREDPYAQKEAKTRAQDVGVMVVILLLYPQLESRLGLGLELAQGLTYFAWSLWGAIILLSALSMKEKSTHKLLALALGLGVLYGGQVLLTPSDHHLKWVPYDEAQIEAYKAEGRPVFVDFTADWCQSCKVFEAQFLNTATMATRFAERGVVPMKADLTQSDDKLWDVLKRLGRSGIPAYVLHPVTGEAQLLPEGAPLSLTERLLGLPVYDAPSTKTP